MAQSTQSKAGEKFNDFEINDKFEMGR